jgi:hypothetical protein
MNELWHKCEKRRCYFIKYLDSREKNMIVIFLNKWLWSKIQSWEEKKKEEFVLVFFLYKVEEFISFYSLLLFLSSIYNLEIYWLIYISQFVRWMYNPHHDSTSYSSLLPWFEQLQPFVTEWQNLSLPVSLLMGDTERESMSER